MASRRLEARERLAEEAFRSLPGLLDRLDTAETALRQIAGLQQDVPMTVTQTAGMGTWIGDGSIVYGTLSIAARLAREALAALEEA